MTGVLRLYGKESTDQLDPAFATGPAARQVLRLFTRQLFSYAPYADLRDWRAFAPVPDLALDVPATYNAGLSVNHKTYTIWLRPNVFWDTTPPREVTAHDVARAFKRMCAAPSATLAYFTSTIRGMAEFRDAYPADETDLTEFHRDNDIAGIRVLDDRTIVFELHAPAADFVHILATAPASVAPVEYDAFAPGSPELRDHLRSAGPYRPAPGPGLRLEPNPVWRQDSDPVRQRLLDAIEVTVGQDDPIELITEGAADLRWGRPLPGPPQATDLGWALDPCLVFNGLDAHVRRAIGHAVDRRAIAEIVGGRPAHCVVPPHNDGHHPVEHAADDDGADPNPYLALPGDAPDRLTAVHSDDPTGLAIATSYAADLAKAGVTVTLVPVDDVEAHLLDPANSWDLAALTRAPDWLGGNGRVFLQPLIEATGYSGADRLVAAALAETDPDRAAAAWREVDVQVLADAAIVPLAVRPIGLGGPMSARVRDAVPMPTMDGHVDLSTVRLTATEDP